MKRTAIFLSFVILFSIIASVGIANDNSEDSSKGDKKIEALRFLDNPQDNKNKEICSDPDEALFPDLARSGCCSWHGGVCGCNQALDRIVCCDGSLSPSCTCSGY